MIPANVSICGYQLLYGGDICFAGRIPNLRETMNTLIIPRISFTMTWIGGIYMAREFTSSIRRGQGTSSLQSIWTILRGIIAAVAATVLGVVLFALAIRWLGVSDTVISVMNQALKLAAIFIGTRACVGRGGTGGIMKGAVVGLAYMMLGILGYAFLSGLELDPAAYLADLGMGVAAGGLCGVIMANLSAKGKK